VERKWWTLLASCIAIFMLLLDVTIVNVALPSIERDLGANFSDLQWVIEQRMRSSVDTRDEYRAVVLDINVTVSPWFLFVHDARNSRAFSTNCSWYWKIPPWPASG
jgi:MFS family permease